MQILKYTTNLVEKNNIFFSENDNSVSYPEDGNEDFYNIEENSFWFTHRNNCIIETFTKNCSSSVFFDIGGGNGFVSKAFQNIGIETFLVEPGLSGCLNAQKRGLKNIICSTLENAGFKTESIPAIGVFDVVEHIENDIEFLNSMYNFLEKDGFITLTVPSFNFLWSKDDVSAKHFRRYSLNDIEKKLKDVGFEITYSTYIFSVLPFPIFLFRTIPTFFGLNKKSDDLKRNVSNHTKKSFFEVFLNKIWFSELKRIKLGKRIIFGGSCLVIAKKN